jgi:nicotinamide mononucleotide transporter
MKPENSPSFYKALEWAAVVLSLGFTFFLAEGFRWSWILGGIASIFYFFLVFRRKLYAESILHFFYIGSALVGFYNWQSISDEMRSQTLELSSHVKAIGMGVTLTAVFGRILSRYTKAKTPYLDSFTTVFSILATVLMVQYVRENWLYWIVIDLASIFLYAYRRMYPSSLLYVIYTGLAIYAFFSWGA